MKEEKIFVKFDDSSKTELVSEQNLKPGFCYRRLRNPPTHATHASTIPNGKFVDDTFVMNEKQLDMLADSSSRIVLRRLSDLVKLAPGNYSPKFFPTNADRSGASGQGLPSFITEVGLFSPNHFKAFFLTQDFTENGRYELIVNYNGSFEMDFVDDWVPVEENTLQHIWGLDVNEAWKIILLKFWAKRCKGYENVKKMPPFFFIESFTNSSWKYHNLQKDKVRFLNHYTGKTELAKILLKTKNNSLVKEAGLIPNSIGYELAKLEKVDGSKGSAKWLATVKSTLVNKWSGNYSVLDKEVNNQFMNNGQSLSLDRDFIISETDMFNLFSIAYVGSKREETNKHYISDYYHLNIQPNKKYSSYLQFKVDKDEWIDLAIRQADNTRVNLSEKSNIAFSNDVSNFGFDDGRRFLKVKFILLKINEESSPSTMTESDYLPNSYDTYEIEYQHGYNRGDAIFLNLSKGTYILKIKGENYGKETHYVVDYTSSAAIKMEEIFPSKKETSLMLREAMCSLINGMVMTTKNAYNGKFEDIVYSDTFESIGYGFVGARLNKKCPYSILIEVDPKQVNSSGYKLKNQFKRLNEPFCVTVKQGEMTAVVLKKIEGVTQSWPPKGINVFRTPEK